MLCNIKDIIFFHLNTTQTKKAPAEADAIPLYYTSLEMILCHNIEAIGRVVRVVHILAQTI